MEGIMPQRGIGAEITGSIPPSEHLIALASPIIPNAEKPLPRRVQIIHLVRSNIAQGNDVLGFLQY